jgi:hypothetical protein
MAFPTASFRFRHFWPEVPDSLHIAAYPCIFVGPSPLEVNAKTAGNEKVFATLL